MAAARCLGNHYAMNNRYAPKGGFDPLSHTNAVISLRPANIMVRDTFSQSTRKIDLKGCDFLQPPNSLALGMGVFCSPGLAYSHIFVYWWQPSKRLRAPRLQVSPTIIDILTTTSKSHPIYRTIMLKPTRRTMNGRYVKLNTSPNPSGPHN